MFWWKTHVPFAHLAEPPGLDLGHGQHTTWGWLHKPNEGQAGPHTGWEHVFIELSKQNQKKLKKEIMDKLQIYQR